MQNLYIIKEPWYDYNWIEGDYTAAVCVEHLNTSFFSYGAWSTRLPELPTGTFVSIDDSEINNYMSYMRDSVSYSRPRREAYSCGCDLDGCDTCYRCVYDEMSTNLYGLGYSKGAWDIDEFNDVIKSIELENIIKNIDKSTEGVSGDLFGISLDFEGDNWGVKNSLMRAYEMYETVQALYDTCKNSDTYLVNQYFARTHGEKTISFENYIAAYDPKTVSIPGSPCSVSRPSNPAGAECHNYPMRWMDSISLAIDALEGSFAASMQNIHKLRSTYNDMKETGICDSDYPEIPKSACNEIETALNTIDSHDSGESNFGQYEHALEKEQNLQRSIYCFPPDFAEYKEIMILLWEKDGGFNPLILERKENGDDALEEANSIYSTYVFEALNYSTELNEKNNELRDNKLELITESDTVVGVAEALESIGTIAERAESFYESLSAADSLYSDSLGAYGRKEDGYLKDATIYIKEALEIYYEMDGKADSILDDALEVVNEKRQTADALIQQAAALYERTSDRNIGRYYDSAKREFETGESASALGDKYRHYTTAADYARIALNNGEFLENETVPLVNQLEDLIRRAEIDYINVEHENDILQHMEDSEEYDSVVLMELIESIIRKAGIKYGHLTETKDVLLEDISDTGGCADGFIGDIETADDGLVTTSGIDYVNAIGRLADIEEEYKRISDDILACGMEMILKNLHISSSVRAYEDIRIGAPTKLSITVLITNLGSRNAEDVDVPVDLGADIPILMYDIKGGAENVASIRNEDGDTVFTIAEIKPYRTFSIVIEKSAVVAELVESEKTGIGNDDGSVDVDETLTFNLYVRGKVEGQSDILETGSYTITRSYRVVEGYEISEEVETYKLGTNVQVEKNIMITPKVDITTMPLTISLDYLEITGLTISARGAVIRENLCGSSDTTCSIQIGNLVEDETATIDLNFIVVDAQGTLSSISMGIPDTENCFGAGKSCGPLPSGLELMLAEMNAAIEANDTATAIRLKEEFKSKIEEWSREQEKTYNKLTALRSEYEAESSEIEDAIEDAGNNTLVEILSERKAILENALDAADEAVDIVDELNILEAIEGKTTEEIINDFMKNAWDSYNELKVRLANAGVSTMPQEFIEVENEFSSLEISKDVKTAVELAEELENAEQVVEEKEEEAAAEIEEIRVQYDELTGDLDELINRYSNQLAEAENTEWEGLFWLEINKIETLSEETKTYLDEGNIKMAKIKMEQLERKKDKIEDILDEIKDSAETTLIYARNSYEGRKDALPDEIRNEIENELSAMAVEIDEGKYIQSMQRGEYILSKIVDYKTETVNPLLIILALVAVGAAVGVYYMKKKGGGEIGEMEINLPFLTKKKKEYKKLAKAEV